MARRKVKPIHGGRSVNGSDAPMTAGDVEEYIRDCEAAIALNTERIASARAALANMRGEVN